MVPAGSSRTPVTFYQATHISKIGRQVPPKRRYSNSCLYNNSSLASTLTPVTLCDTVLTPVTLYDTVLTPVTLYDTALTTVTLYGTDCAHTSYTV
jgi:hypothetical protein